MVKLGREFIEERLKPLKHIPHAWEMTSIGNGYVLDLRMCFLTRLLYDFKWGDDSIPVASTLPIVEQPSRIWKIDVSMNDIQILDSECLIPFKGVRSFNASINRLESFPGIGCLLSLVQLDLSFNFISNLSNLNHSTRLKELRLSHNNLTSLETLPLLSRLTYLNLDGNSLDNLDGVFSLPSLKELSARKNRIKTMTPLAACRALITIDLTSNAISDMEDVIFALEPVLSLKELTLASNPVAQNPQYATLLRNKLKLSMIDGLPLVSPQEQMKKKLNVANNDVEVFREVAKKTYMDRIRGSRLTMQENIRHLQKRIIAMQEDQDALETKLRSELNATLSHIDFLDSQTLENFRHASRKPENLRQPTQFKSKEEVFKRSQTKDPESVLQAATLQLAREIQHTKPPQPPAAPHYHPTISPLEDDLFQ